MRFICLFLLIGIRFLNNPIIQAQNNFSVFNLTCEHENNPLGVENTHPRFSWQIQSQVRNFEQGAWQVLVASTQEELDTEKGDIWDSGKINNPQSILIPFEGSPLQSGTLYYWKVKIWDKQGNESAWSLPACFRMGLLNESDWKKASWIALEKDKEDETVTTGIHAPYVADKFGDRKTGMYRMPQFRKEFQVNKAIKHATAYVSGLGHFDMFINGSKAGDNFLDPGWTKYDRCALYVTFDITSQLEQGFNTIGVMLGNGFYNIPRERYLKMLTSYGAPKLIMKIEIEYQDGTKQEFITDKSWKVSESPVTFSSIYGGEDYDATKEEEGWMKPGFNDKHWQPVILTKWKTTLLSQRSTPLQVRDKLPTVQLLKTEKGDWVYDLGQNFSGIPELIIKGEKGKSVKLHPAELLNPDQSVNQSASGSPFYFTYTLKGKENEIWRPQFTYYGFRYVQIEGAVPEGEENPEGLPEVVQIKGLHTCNSAEETGYFHCSNEMFNKIYSLIDWSIRSNMASVLTDCPHREKLGWLEVAHLMQYSIQYRYHVARLYGKIMNDMRSTQAVNGQIPTTAPELVEFEGGFKDTPEWGSAFIISPWYIYQWYGDKQLLEDFYPDMQRYLNYLSSQATDYILSYGLGDWYDIGPEHPGYAQLTTNGLTATAIYYYNAVIMEKTALLMGKPEDARQYEKLSKDIKEAFNRNFWNKDSQTYDRNSQTASAVAIYMGLVNEENKEQTFLNLVNDIRGRNNALTAGDVGYRYVLRALEQENASDIIYDMNCKYDVPGYGWQLAHGATALTESWQAYGFVSNNHCMLGHLMEWLFSGIGGIRPKENAIGFKEFIIKPEMVGDIRDATVTHHSPYGRIQSNWKKNIQGVELTIEVPANSYAYIYIPAGSKDKMYESGVEINQVQELTLMGTDKEHSIIKVGSGIYNFKTITN